MDEIIKDKIKIIPLDKENNFWIAGQMVLVEETLKCF
jgi:hypothetical protein